MTNIRIKVCGMREPQNIEDLVKLKPDLMGFIFYSKSKRYVGEEFDSKRLDKLPSSILKVGVFVNEGIETLLKKQKQFKFDYLQLHGDEPVEICQQLKHSGIKVIKAFSVSSDFDFELTKPYVDSCAYFLFDTKGEDYGGNGLRFDWNLLKKYNQGLPFFLSGGIDLENVDELKHFEHPDLYALDVNSRFEVQPGMKDLGGLEELFIKLRKPQKV